MSKPNYFSALQKAYKAQAITSDNYSLQTYFDQEAEGKGENRMAVMILKGIQSKFVPSQVNKVTDDAPSGNGNRGFRTRFILDTGETVGTMSNGAHEFARFFAGIMGYSGEENFIEINIEGTVQVEVRILKLDGKKKTYDFQLVDGDVAGFSDYKPDFSKLALEGPGQSEPEPETESEPE